MGQAASFVNQQLEQQNIEKKKTMDDALQGLKASADSKIQLFYEKIEAAEDSKLIPINRVISKFQFVQCKVSQDTNQLKGEIGGLVKDIAGGQWADAIADTASAVINGMLGSASSGITERSSYCISMDALGGVSRLDAYYLAYTFTAATLITDVQNFVACCVVKSSVDMKSLDDDSLRIIVNDSFPALPNAQKALLLEQVQIALLPLPPSDKQVAGTKALAKFWDDNAKGPEIKVPVPPQPGPQLIDPAPRPPVPRPPPSLDQPNGPPWPVPPPPPHPPVAPPPRPPHPIAGVPPGFPRGRGSGEGPKLESESAVIPYYTSWKLETYHELAATQFGDWVTDGLKDYLYTVKADIQYLGAEPLVTLKTTPTTPTDKRGGIILVTILQELVDAWNMAARDIAKNPGAVMTQFEAGFIIVEQQIIMSNDESHAEQWNKWLHPNGTPFNLMVKKAVPYKVVYRFGTWDAVLANTFATEIGDALKAENLNSKVDVVDGNPGQYVVISVAGWGDRTPPDGDASDNGQVRGQFVVDKVKSHTDNWNASHALAAEKITKGAESILVDGDIVRPGTPKWTAWLNPPRAFADFGIPIKMTKDTYYRVNYKLGTWSKATALLFLQGLTTELPKYKIEVKTANSTDQEYIILEVKPVSGAAIDQSGKHIITTLDGLVTTWNKANSAKSDQVTQSAAALWINEAWVDAKGKNDPTGSIWTKWYDGPPRALADVAVRSMQDIPYHTQWDLAEFTTARASTFINFVDANLVALGAADATSRYNCFSVNNGIDNFIEFRMNAVGAATEAKGGFAAHTALNNAVDQYNGTQGRLNSEKAHLTDEWIVARNGDKVTSATLPHTVWADFWAAPPA